MACSLIETLGRLKDSNWRIRNEALNDLEKIGDKSIINELLSLLFNDPSMPVRIKSAKVLKSLGGIPFEKLKNVIVNLSNREWQRRVETCEILGYLGDSSVVNLLINAVNDSNDDVKHAAIGALAEIGSIKGIPILHQLNLKGGSYPMHQSPSWAMREIFKKNPGKSKCRFCSVEIEVSDIENEYVSYEEIQCFVKNLSSNSDFKSKITCNNGLLCSKCYKIYKNPDVIKVNQLQNTLPNSNKNSLNTNQSQIEKNTISFHNDSINSIVVLPRSNSAFAASSDGMISMLDYSNLTIDTFAKQTKTINSLAISTCGQILIVASSDPAVNFYDISSKRVIKSYKKYAPPIKSVVLSKDKKFMVVAQGTKIRLINFATLDDTKEANATKSVTNTVYSLSLSSDDKYVISGSSGI
ncbi:MAG: hypothetical protein GYA62_12925, partial [Bacteroidales bacterium]|nr:hypothetical protein [Bacteroidales bacterium]